MLLAPALQVLGVAEEAPLLQGPAKGLGQIEILLVAGPAVALQQSDRLGGEPPGTAGPRMAGEEGVGEQRKVAEEVKAALDAAKKYPAPIATKIEGEQVFWKAEEYHQKYYERNGKKPYCHIVPYAEEK